MNKTIVKVVLALGLIGPATWAQAAEVLLTGWLYGTGAPVTVALSNGDMKTRAGAMLGALNNAPGFDATPFITYSVEFGLADLRFSPRVATYDLVAGASYFERRLGDAGVAEQLAQLMTYATDHAALVSDAAGSASLQLAIWSAVNDAARAPTGITASLAARDVLAQALLADSRGIESRYDVWVLERAASPDLLVLAARAAADGELPEPGTLSLSLLAMAGGLALARRRRAR